MTAISVGHKTIAPSGAAALSALPAEFGFLRGLIQGMRCGVLSIDREGHLLMINEPACQILELSTPPARGTPLAEALSLHPQLVQVLQESFSMSSLPNRAELLVRTVKGDTKTIGFTVSLVRDDQDQLPVGAAVFFKDLTRIEHLEEQERLKERLAALGQMAASMAHEIRNPLASIEITCGLLRRRYVAEAGGRELLDKITGAVHRLNRTITSGLEYVRPVEVTVAPAELHPVLEEAIAVALERCATSRVEVRRRFAREMPPFVMDRGALRQVFENLLVNALEAVGPQGTVSVETQVVAAPVAPSIPYLPDRVPLADPWQNVERLAVIKVGDSGPGIPDEERDKVFYPFFTTKREGCGVGLSTSKKIVDSHRGLIDVGRAPEGGALFTVRLPMIPPQERESR
ncbi:MAG TPA: ATP-binding protein [Candidatus Polarisedimenticolaceae bacterium]|nr:ATP-binding protein [Candidatus Polarisedimenticolaceae bacterium]